ncbi:MAG: cytochrome P460 family protein [Caulobacteraceae bacterium]
MRIQSLAMIALALTAVGAAGGLAFAAQDRSALKVPDGLAFSEFKGYEAWEAVAPSQVPGEIKVIAANPTMMAAYKKGLPASGKTFPDGSKVVKIDWLRKPNPASPYAVDVPGELKSIAFILKDTKRFPKTHGWAYAAFSWDPATKTLKPEGKGAECGYECHSKVSAQDYIYTAYPAR